MTVLGDKLPRYYLFDFSKFNEELKKTVKFIHISRNPLDVINSMIVRHQNKSRGKDTWTLTSTLEEAINEWILGWNYIIKNESNHILHIKYEDLCLFDKIGTIEKICDFVNVKNEFNLEIIQSDRSKHFERNKLNEDYLFRIKKKLGDIIFEWNDNDLGYLKQKYGEYKAIELSKKKVSLINKVKLIGKRIF